MAGGNVPKLQFPDQLNSRIQIILPELIKISDTLQVMDQKIKIHFFKRRDGAVNLCVTMDGKLFW